MTNKVSMPDSQEATFKVFLGGEGPHRIMGGFEVKIARYEGHEILFIGVSPIYDKQRMPSNWISSICDLIEGSIDGNGTTWPGPGVPFSYGGDRDARSETIPVVIDHENADRIDVCDWRGFQANIGSTAHFTIVPKYDFTEMVARICAHVKCNIHRMPQDAEDLPNASIWEVSYPQFVRHCGGQFHKAKERINHLVKTM